MSFGFANTVGALPPTISAGTQAGATNNGTIVFSNSNNVTFGMTNSSQITATIAPPTISFWHNMLGATSKIATGNSLTVFPLTPFEPFPGLMTISTLLMNMNGTSSQTVNATFRMSLGLYTLNASTLSLLNSVSTSVQLLGNASVSWSFSGPRWFSINSSVWSAQPTLSQTNYWVGVVFSAGTGPQGIDMVGANVMELNNNRFGTVGVSTGAAISTAMAYPFMGTVNTNGIPVSIAQSQVVSAGVFNGTIVPHMVFNNQFAQF